MSAYKHNIYISNSQHFQSHLPYIYNKINVLLFFNLFILR